MGHTECLAQSLTILTTVYLLRLRVHSAQCCSASSCHAGVGPQSVPSVQLCCCAAAVADAKRFDASCSWLENKQHVICVLDGPGACCYSDGEGDHVFW